MHWRKVQIRERQLKAMLAKLEQDAMVGNNKKKTAAHRMVCFDGERVYGQIPGCRPAPHDETLLEKENLQPESIADYYVDTIRRYTRLPGNHLYFLTTQDNKLDHRMSDRNMPFGWYPKVPEPKKSKFANLKPREK